MNIKTVPPEPYEGKGWPRLAWWIPSLYRQVAHYSSYHWKTSIGKMDSIKRAAKKGYKIGH